MDGRFIIQNIIFMIFVSQLAGLTNRKIGYNTQRFRRWRIHNAKSHLSYIYHLATILYAGQNKKIKQTRLDGRSIIQRNPICHITYLTWLHNGPLLLRALSPVSKTPFIKRLRTSIHQAARHFSTGYRSCETIALGVYHSKIRQVCQQRRLQVPNACLNWKVYTLNARLQYFARCDGKTSTV